MIKLREYIKNQGFRKDFFAEKLGVTPTTLSAWLTGRTLPTFRNMVTIDKITKGAVAPKDWITEKK